MKNKNTSDIVESLFFNYNGQVFLSHVYVKLDNFKFNKFPFVDTLSFLHPVSGKLHNIKGKNTLELTSTGGDSYENYDGDSRSSSLRTLLEEAVNDPDYYGYRDLIEKALDNLSSS